jgi:hypothetical protein
MAVVEVCVPSFDQEVEVENATPSWIVSSASGVVSLVIGMETVLLPPAPSAQVTV